MTMHQIGLTNRDQAEDFDSGSDALKVEFEAADKNHDATLDKAEYELIVSQNRCSEMSMRRTPTTTLRSKQRS